MSVLQNLFKISFGVVGRPGMVLVPQNLLLLNHLAVFIDSLPGGSVSKFL